MLNRYQNVLLTGDLHLGDVSFKHQDQLIDLIKKNDFDCIVLGGDTFDFWRGGKMKNVVARFDQIFKQLQNHKAEVVFIKGNHDQNIDFLKSFGFTVEDRFRYLTADNRLAQVMHGHEFDRPCQRWAFAVKPFARVEEKINKCLKKLDSEYVVRMTKLLGQGKHKRYWKSFYDNFSFLRDIDLLFFGHTHVPLEGSYEKLDFYNWGCWQQGYNVNPGYLINRKGKVENHVIE